MIVLLDTCVILDALQNRVPFAEDAQKIFLAVANKQIEACITAKSVADIYYLTHKLTHSDKLTREILAKLFTLFNLLDTTSKNCKDALFSPMIDYEDAIMVETAKNAAVDHVVTRNIKDYAKASISVITPSELLEKITS